jgi:hypothetical protein
VDRGTCDTTLRTRAMARCASMDIPGRGVLSQNSRDAAMAGWLDREVER